MDIKIRHNKMTPYREPRRATNVLVNFAGELIVEQDEGNWAFFIL